MPEENDPTTPPEGGPNIQQLRERAEKAGQLESSNAQKDREIEFLRAGVNTGTLFGRNVMAAHGDKEITPEAITETVTAVRAELGMPDPEATPPAGTGELTAEEQIAQAQANLHGGQRPPGSTPPPVDKSLIDVAVDSYQEARKNGMGEVEAQEAGIGEIIRAGANGHRQAAYSEAAFQEQASQYGHGKEYSGLPERSYTPNVHHTKEHANKR